MSISTLVNYEKHLFRQIEYSLLHGNQIIIPFVREGIAAYLRLRHQALYQAIQSSNITVSSSWKMLLAVSLQHGDTVLDIGANLGYISQAAAWLVGKKGAVHSFEPSPRVAGLLQRRIAYLNLHNVQVNQCAVGAQAGNAILHEYLEGNGGSSSLRANSWGRNAHDYETSVVVQTVDQYIKEHNIGSVRLIKIDVEGAELEVLQGAEMVITEQHPVLLVEAANETCQAFGHSIEQLIATIRAFDYQIYSWRGSSLISINHYADIPATWHHDDLICFYPPYHNDISSRLTKRKTR